jgi:hypothetical protein
MTDKIKAKVVGAYNKYPKQEIGFARIYLGDDGKFEDEDAQGGFNGSYSDRKYGTWKITSVDEQAQRATLKLIYTSSTTSIEVGMNDRDEGHDNSTYEREATVFYGKKEMRVDGLVYKQ